jgi:hypothetical protein
MSSSNITLIVSLGFMALSAGLFSNFDATTSTSSVLGLEVLFSVGAGLGAFRFALPQSIMWPVISIHSVNCRPQESTDGLDLSKLMIYLEFLGGAIGIAAAQAVFVSELTRTSPNDQEAQFRSIILQSGATNFKSKLSSDTLHTAVALKIVNRALTRTFFVTTAAGALPIGIIGLMATPPFLFFLFFFWQRQKKRKEEQKAPHTGILSSLPQMEQEKTDPEPLSRLESEFLQRRIFELDSPNGGYPLTRGPDASTKITQTSTQSTSKVKQTHQLVYR